MNRQPLWVCALACTAACLDTTATDRVEVIVQTGVDATTGGGHYAIEAVELPGLVDLATLESTLFEPSFHARLVADVTGATPAVTVDTSEASAPPVRTRRVGDVSTPRDFRTLVMVSAYHELAAVTAAAANMTGIADVGSQPAPLKLLFEPALVDDDGTIGLRSNAFYEPHIHGFGIVASAETEVIPVGTSRPVLAHEFGHHLFQISFGDADGICRNDQRGKLAPGRLDEELVIRGINEGFADLMGFTLTGVTNTEAGVFADSGERSIDPTTENFADFAWETMDSKCSGSHYCVGTLFARAVFAAGRAEAINYADETARFAWGREVFTAMALVPAAMRADPALPELGQGDCGDVSESLDRNLANVFVRAFVAAMPAARHAALCTAFDHFLAFKCGAS